MILRRLLLVFAIVVGVALMPAVALADEGNGGTEGGTDGGGAGSGGPGSAGDDGESGDADLRS